MVEPEGTPVGLAEEAWVREARGVVVEPTADALRAEILPMAAMAAHLDVWRDLQARALEQNIFLEPGFALPLFATKAGRWRMLLVWTLGDASGRDRLVGLLPVRRPRFGWGVPGGLAVGVRDPMTTCGTPLLDRDRGGEAFAAMLGHLARPPFRAAGLALTEVPCDGPFARLLADGAAHAVAALGGYERAALRRAGGNVLSLASAKTRKERKRQRRRLGEQGECAYSSARALDAVHHATERFLLLERKGWKGARGTALLADDRLAAFTRAMTAAMAADGKCRIDALEVDGAAVAMGIVLTSGDRAHFGKTAFDEDRAQLSPGVHFAIDLADAQLRDATVALTDSCAVPDHPMIGRLWPDRIGVVDLAVACRPEGTRAFAAAVVAERVRRRLRALAKAGANACRRRVRRFVDHAPHHPSDRPTTR